MKVYYRDIPLFARDQIGALADYSLDVTHVLTFPLLTPDQWKFICTILNPSVPDETKELMYLQQADIWSVVNACRKYDIPAVYDYCLEQNVKELRKPSSSITPTAIALLRLREYEHAQAFLDIAYSKMDTEEFCKYVTQCVPSRISSARFHMLFCVYRAVLQNSESRTKYNQLLTSLYRTCRTILKQRFKACVLRHGPQSAAEVTLDTYNIPPKGKPRAKSWKEVEAALFTLFEITGGSTEYFTRYIYSNLRPLIGAACET